MRTFLLLWDFASLMGGVFLLTSVAVGPQQVLPNEPVLRALSLALIVVFMLNMVRVVWVATTKVEK